MSYNMDDSNIHQNRGPVWSMSYNMDDSNIHQNQGPGEKRPLLLGREEGQDKDKVNKDDKLYFIILAQKQALLSKDH